MNDDTDAVNLISPGRSTVDITLDSGADKRLQSEDLNMGLKGEKDSTESVHKEPLMSSIRLR